ncbi:hypothetical protein [Arcanobacterium haemolyticum]
MSSFISAEFATSLAAITSSVFSFLAWKRDRQRRIDFSITHWDNNVFLLRNTGTITAKNVVPGRNDFAAKIPSGEPMTWDAGKDWATIQPGEVRQLRLPLIASRPGEPLFPPQILIRCRWHQRRPIPVDVSWPEDLVYARA